MFGDTLKALRKSKGLTQIEFARTLNVAIGTVGNWEVNARTPDYALLIQIADFFDVSIDFLLGREDNYGVPYPYSEQNRPEQKKPVAERQAKPEKSDIQLIYDSLNPRQQMSLLAYAEGMLAANDTTLADLKNKKA